MVLADRDANLALFEERSQAMAIAHAELEDRHKDTLFGLRETQDKVGVSVCLSWKALTRLLAVTGYHMGTSWVIGSPQLFRSPGCELCFLPHLLTSHLQSLTYSYLLT